MYTLVVCGEDGAVLQRLPIRQGEWLIGRQDGNHVVLASPSVSREHARIYTAQRKCFIQDLKSSNGVVIDGRKIQEVEELQPAQRVQIGDFQLFLKPEGAPDPPSDPMMSTHIVDQDREYWKLIGMSGAFEGEAFTLSERENTIGRTEDNLILLPDASVSREHARIVVEEDERHVIFDRHSSNGTYVNRRRVQRAVLRDGDVVTVGNVVFRFVAPRSTSGARAKLASPGRGRTALVVTLVVVLLLMAGATVGLVLYKSHKRRKAQEAAQQAYQQAVVAGKTAVTKRKWVDAIRDLERATEFNPTDPRLKELLAKARAEQENKKLLARGEELFATDRLEEAITVLARIPPGSDYGASVAQKLKDIRSRLAQQLFVKGVAACKRRRRAACHELLSKSLDIEPGNADALKRLRRLERKMRRKRIKFERWQPTGGGQ